MQRKLTKAELSTIIAGACAISKKEGRELLELILQAMVGALRRGERVEIRSFGSLATRARRPRTGRNPKTGVKVLVEAKRVAYFRASKHLKTILSPPAGAASGLRPARGGDQENALSTLLDTASS